MWYTALTPSRSAAEHRSCSHVCPQEVWPGLHSAMTTVDRTGGSAELYTLHFCPRLLSSQCSSTAGWKWRKPSILYNSSPTLLQTPTHWVSLKCKPFSHRNLLVKIACMLFMELMDLHIEKNRFSSFTVDATRPQVLIPQWDLAPFPQRQRVCTMQPLFARDSVPTVGQKKKKKLTWKLITEGHFLLSSFKLWPSSPSSIWFPLSPDIMTYSCLSYAQRGQRGRRSRQRSMPAANLEISGSFHTPHFIHAKSLLFNNLKFFWIFTSLHKAHLWASK